MDFVDNKHRFLQFELWKDCGNNCKFCQNRGLGDVDKLTSLNFVIEKLKSNEINKYNELGFIGGEFFDTQLNDITIKDKFYDLFTIVAQLVHMNKINKVYVTTALIFDNRTYLIEFIDFLITNKIDNNVLICTSYDTKYRFHTEYHKKMWEDNMLFIKNNYPTIHVHTETIVTEHFINEVLTNKFNIKEFEQTFNTHIDYIEPHTGFYYKDKDDFIKNVPEFLPYRKSFLKFLDYTVIKNKLIDINFLFNKNLKSNDFYINYKNGKLIKFVNRRGSEDRTCGVDIDHIPHWGYCDATTDIYDDVRNLRESIQYGD